VKCWLQILLSGGKGHFGVFRKMKWVKGSLVGPGSHVCHVIDNSFYYNSILVTGGNGRAIGCNWGGGSIVHFLSLGGGGIEKLVIVEGGKV
jgi:hypothetical protein